MRAVFLLLLWMGALFGVETYGPALQIEVNGMAKDIVLDGDRLCIGTDTGRLQVYDTIQKAFVKEITIPDIKDFTGEQVPATVFSIDYRNGKYILLSDSGIGGYSNLWVHENNQTRQLIDPKEKKPIIKARFVDDRHLLLGYLSNEAALYDLDTGKESYRVQLCESRFSDFALNDDHTKAVFACESGILYLIDVVTGKVIRELKGMNLDNVYKVDFKDSKVSGAGQDRRGSIYDVETGKGEYIEGKFLIYATGLSPSAQRVAFAMDEQNNIYIYNTGSKKQIALLKGQKSTLNAILFKDEKRLFSASDDSTVMMWKIK